jgi:hypothetical protein
MIWIAAGASYALTMFLLLRALHYGALEDEARTKPLKTIFYARRHACASLAFLSILLTLFLATLGILT